MLLSDDTNILLKYFQKEIHIKRSKEYKLFYDFLNHSNLYDFKIHELNG